MPSRGREITAGITGIRTVLRICIRRAPRLLVVPSGLVPRWPLENYGSRQRRRSSALPGAALVEPAKYAAHACISGGCASIYLRRPARLRLGRAGFDSGSLARHLHDQLDVSSLWVPPFRDPGRLKEQSLADSHHPGRRFAQQPPLFSGVREFRTPLVRGRCHLSTAAPLAGSGPDLGPPSCLLF